MGSRIKKTNMGVISYYYSIKLDNKRTRRVVAHEIQVALVGLEFDSKAWPNDKIAVRSLKRATLTTRITGRVSGAQLSTDGGESDGDWGFLALGEQRGTTDI